jgi:hypothetical protein
VFLRPIILLFVTATAFAQANPEMFQPDLISNNKVFGFTLSPDGKEAFWVHSNGGRDTLVIYTSTLVKGKWQQPQPASFSGKPGIWKDIDPVFSPDGKILLYQSTRPVDGKPNRTGFDIWALKKTKGGWSDPYHLGNKINTDDSESFASITSTGNIYFTKQGSGSFGLADIYVSTSSNNDYSEAVNPGMPLNSTHRDGNPFVSAKEDYIIYLRSDSTSKNAEMYISFRENGTWKEPVKLSGDINSATNEFCPFYHEKQKKLYFCRTQVLNSGRRIENTFSVDFDPYDYK